MADADWDIVQRYVYVKDPYATRKVERDLDQLTNTAPITCPKCLAAEQTNDDPTPSEWREMMHEARLRLLKAEKVKMSCHCRCILVHVHDCIYNVVSIFSSTDQLLEAV